MPAMAFGMGWLSLALLVDVTMQYGKGEPAVRYVIFLVFIVPFVAIGLLSLCLPLWRAIELRHLSYEIWPRELVIRRGVLRKSMVRVPLAEVRLVEVSRLPFGIGGNVGTVSIPTGPTRFGLVHQRLAWVKRPDEVAYLLEQGRNRALDEGLRNLS
jgi:membrane protein YdbS with pleckstrin-like domain